MLDKMVLESEEGRRTVADWLEQKQQAGVAITPDDGRRELDHLFRFAADLRTAHHNRVWDLVISFMEKIDESGLPRWVYTGQRNVHLWESRAVLFQSADGIDRWRAAARRRVRKGHNEVEIGKDMLKAADRAEAALGTIDVTTIGAADA